jgi:diaminohydroxyphosphoribosylaminopyrimidine deaminase/5-amino-6-(5-phosphoribosylamino)uracil reductase
MMARAVQLARKGCYWSAPNPHVGCVLVRDGVIIGEGFTRPAGGNHAEIEALQDAGGAQGATAYVTLEPCSHHGRTGPCADALVAAGVRRVVVATQDPNPQVAGAGLARLLAAGVAVESGLLASGALALNPGFIARMTRGRGRVRAKLAMSLDGRTAMASGESQWITGPGARRDVQRLRARSCAIVTGIGTVLADDCALTVRPAELGLGAEDTERASQRQPLRVVLDSWLRTPAAARVVSGTATTVLFHGRDARGDSGTGIPAWLAARTGQAAAATSSAVELMALPRTEQGLDLQAMLAALSQRQCNEILVESGPRLAGALLRQGLLDELIVYMAPTLLGDTAQPLLHLPLERMSEQVRLQVRDMRRVGEDWRLTLAAARNDGSGEEGD